MATPKTIVAHDIEQGKLIIIRRGSTVQYERRYKFLDAGDIVIDTLAGNRITDEIPIASLPANIIAALTTIDAWTYAQALAQEGMD